MHGKIDRIKGLKTKEPCRNEIFTDANHESAAYRKSSTEIFTKCNESTLDTVKHLKPLARARVRKQSINSDLLNFTLSD